jgi:hypothetical protein
VIFSNDLGNTRYQDQNVCPNIKLNWSHENFWGLLFHWDLNCIREIYFAQNKNQRNYSNTKKFTA